MNKDLSSFVKNRALATFRVRDYLEVYSKYELADMIGISRPTIDVRLEKHTWKMKELENIIEKLPELV